MTNRNDLIFVVIQGEANKEILEKICSELGFGSIYKQGKRVYRYIIQKREEIELIILLFNGNLVLPSRKTQFHAFLTQYNLKCGGLVGPHIKGPRPKAQGRFATQSGPGLEPFTPHFEPFTTLVGALSKAKRPAQGTPSKPLKVKKAPHLNQPICYENRANLPSFENTWFLGFVEAEGCFSISLLANSVAFRTRFVVSQKGDVNIPILSHLILMFGAGAVCAHHQKDNYTFYISHLK